MYSDKKSTNEWFVTPFMQSVSEIPAWVIFCNAAGQINGDEM